MLMPICLLWAKPRITMYPPGGSSVADGIKVIRIVHNQASHLKPTEADWEAAKPTKIKSSSQYEALAAQHKPNWISWDDDFVDELRTTLKAFWVFAFLPLWYMADGGTNTILTNMAGSMTTNGLPNDLLFNFNPISTVIAIPIYNWVLYPGLRKRGINFSLIQRMSCGYFIGALLNACAAVIQWQVYETSPCGYRATDCEVGAGVSPLVSEAATPRNCRGGSLSSVFANENQSAWLTVIPFYLQPLGGILISVSSYEIAYTMTPPRMKGSVIAVVFFTYAISQAIVEIASPAFRDPHLVWPL
jgi:POT family proton-dependent oligopeptide transporter